ncbi:hypothetical protein [Colwellia psychrerythraea]|uniref:Uncharacterized protein n=1 Tax=Colwellia psychrerythraea TaxID=28229 RepID=A0A099KIU4_COLPS|nr:hypothetical protein [Colwellia psychrerythraea]KGJ89513.1 hypothetical protein GAB14E_0706 [Colwellia psychrerythraea]
MDKSIIVFGTIFAAFIAGVFSYFNLINSKEQKVSEFRQSWINDFRKELAALVASVFYLAYYYSNTIEPKASDVEESHRLYVAACTGLLTRINAKDPDIPTKHLNSTFLTNLNELQNAFNLQDYNKVKILANFLVKSSSPLLKAEWERVKRGEESYRRTKIYAGLVCAVGLIVISIFLNAYTTMASST